VILIVTILSACQTPIGIKKELQQEGIIVDQSTLVSAIKYNQFETVRKLCESGLKVKKEYFNYTRSSKMKNILRSAYKEQLQAIKLEDKQF